jgi:hypothetical protein
MDVTAVTRSCELSEQARALRAWSRDLRRSGRCRRNPVRGGSDDGDLTMHVRAALATGALPPAPNRAFGGRGNGETCVVCDKKISPKDISYEAIQPRRVVAHLECFQIWQSESLQRRRRPNRTEESH